MTGLWSIETRLSGAGDAIAFGIGCALHGR